MKNPFKQNPILLVIPMLIVFVICIWCINAIFEVNITGQTRIHKQTFADDRAEYTAEYEEQNGFGVSKWFGIPGNPLRCLDFKWSEDEPKRIIKEYYEEKSLECEQIKIDSWLADLKSKEVVASEYIKYP